MNIDVANSKCITSMECIDCQLCALSSPQEGCIETMQFRRTFKLKDSQTRRLKIFLNEKISI